jgi:hypothetical protein
MCSFSVSNTRAHLMVVRGEHILVVSTCAHCPYNGYKRVWCNVTLLTCNKYFTVSSWYVNVYMPFGAVGNKKRQGSAVLVIFHYELNKVHF